MKEEAVVFGSSESLVGIVTDPSGETATDPTRIAFLFLNAGVTHRVGPNRLYVRLARAVAAEGFVALRFDYSGLGDSGPRTDDLPAWQSVPLETREAMDMLARTRGIEGFVLVGICSGAISAYLSAHEDPRVVGAVLINAQLHLHGNDPDLGAHLRARTVARHSWRIALFSSFRGKNWRKAFKGRLNPVWLLQVMIGVPFRLIFRRRKPPAEPAAEVRDPMADLEALAQKGVQVFHLYCEGDEGLDYFHVVLGRKVREVASGSRSRLEVIRGANHVFTLLWSQDHFVNSVCEWARTLTSAAEPAPKTPTG